MNDRCPTCESPAPERHPAMQFEGEVQICRDTWHAPPAPVVGLAPFHVLVWDPAASGNERWTCRDCGRAVLRTHGNVYGSAVDGLCPPKAPGMQPVEKTKMERLRELCGDPLPDMDETEVDELLEEMEHQARVPADLSPELHRPEVGELAYIIGGSTAEGTTLVSLSGSWLHGVAIVKWRSAHRSPYIPEPADPYVRMQAFDSAVITNNPDVARVPTSRLKEAGWRLR